MNLANGHFPLTLLAAALLTGCLNLRSNDCLDGAVSLEGCPEVDSGPDGLVIITPTSDAGAISVIDGGQVTNGGVADAGNGAFDAGRVVDDLRPVNGSRLKVRWQEARPGYGTFAGWYDSQLKQDCSFLPAVDGELRCVPGELLGSYSDMFLDSACTRPAPIFGAGASPCYKLPTVVRRDDEADLNRCSATGRAFKVRLVARDQVFAKDTNSGLCVPADYAPGDRLFTLGDEMPPASFVKAMDTVVSVSGSNDLELRQIVAEDGSKAVPRLRARMADEDCRFELGSDGRAHCLPPFKEVVEDKRFSGPGFSGFEHYSDSACSTYVITSNAVKCEKRPVPLARISKTDVCPSEQRWTSLGPVVDKVFVSDLGVCKLETRDYSSARFNAIGPPVSIDTFPAVGLIHDETTTSPLRLEFWALPDGRRLSTGGWFDSSVDDGCELVAVGDEHFRCVSGRYEASSRGYWFSDALCTVPLSVTWDGACPDKYAVFDDPVSCSGAKSFHTVGPKHTDAVFSRLVASNGVGPCMPAELPKGYVAYAISPPVPPSRFQDVVLTAPAP
jgi:hypothetical protein